MSEEQGRTSSARRRAVIRSHSLYNPEASGPIVDEGYVAERVRAFEGIFKRHWIPAERPPPPELSRDFASRLSLRAVSYENRDNRPSSSLSSAYVSIDDTPSRTQARRLSYRRFQPFSSNISGDQTPLSRAATTPTRQPVSEEQKRRIRQYLAMTEPGATKEPHVPRGTVRGLLSPYIRSPMRTRPVSRLDTSFFASQIDLGQVSPTKQRKTLEGAVSRLDAANSFTTETTSRPSDALDNARQTEQPGSEDLMRTASPHVGSSEALDASSLPYQPSNLPGQSITPRSRPSSDTKGAATGVLPPSVWLPQQETFEHSDLSPEPPSPLGDVNDSGLQYRNLSVGPQSRGPQTRNGPPRPLTSLGLQSLYLSPEVTLLRHRSSIEDQNAPDSRQKDREPQIHGQNHAAQPESPERNPSKMGKGPEKIYRVAKDYSDEGAQKVPVWDIDGAHRPLTKQHLSKVPLEKPGSFRAQLEHEPIDFNQTPPSTEVAKIKNTIPIYSTGPNSASAMSGANTPSDYFGYASRRLRDDLYSVSDEILGDQAKDRRRANVQNDLNQAVPVEKLVKAISQESESPNHLPQELPPGISKGAEAYSEETSIVGNPEIVEEKPLHTRLSQHESVQTLPKSPNTYASLAKRTSSLSRLLRKASSWRLVLVDKEKGGNKIGESTRKASVPVSEVGSIIELTEHDGSGEENGLIPTESPLEKIVQPQRDGNEAPLLEGRQQMEQRGTWIPRQRHPSVQGIAARSDLHPQGSKDPEKTESVSPWVRAFKLESSPSSSPLAANKDTANYRPNAFRASSYQPPPIAADNCVSTSPWVDNAVRRSSPKGLSPATNGDSLYYTPGSPLSEPHPNFSANGMPTSPVKRSRTQTGSRGIRPSTSWIKPSSQAPSRRRSSLTPGSRVRNAIRLHESRGDLKVSQVAEMAPKVGSLAALTYIKNSSPNHHRRNQPSISVEVLSAPIDLSDEEDIDGGQAAVDTADEERVDIHQAQHTLPSRKTPMSSRASTLMRKGGVEGPRVKQVSVVVSLDGPADLRIDASVKKRRMRRSRLELRRALTILENGKVVDKDRGTVFHDAED